MTGRAKLVISAEVVNKLGTWGYIINGVSLILSGTQIIAGITIGAASAIHGNAIGLTAGVLLIVHGFNGAQESTLNIKNGSPNAVGAAKHSYMAVAEFMGFSSKTGQLAYNSMDLALSGYGLTRFVLKPEVCRLYRYLPTDFVRSFRQTSVPSLAFEAIGDAITIKTSMDSHKEN